MTEEINQNPDNTEKKQRSIENLKPFQPGISGNPKGRPKGSKNIITLYKEAFKKIGELQKIDPDDVEIKMAIKGIMEAVKGNYQFYRDYMDRRFGKPTDYNINLNIDYDKTIDRIGKIIDEIEKIG